jgi:hypothetical protein
MTPTPTHKRLGLRAVLLIFLLCAILDFGWGYFEKRSLPHGVISVVFGLFGTAFYAWLMGVFRTEENNKSDSDDPNEPSRWVP